MPTQQRRRAASAPWCGSALKMLLMPLGPIACLLPCTRRGGTPPQVPVPSDAHAPSEVVDSTLVERAAAAAALGSAVHDVRRVQSESEVPEVCTVTACCLLLTRIAAWCFAGLCRSLLQRAAARETCLHMRHDLNASNPRMRGWIQRCLLTAISSMNRVPQQIFKLRGHDRVEH